MKTRLLLMLALIGVPAVAFGGGRITHHTIQAEIDPYRSKVIASDRMTIEGQGSSEFRFLLNRNLTIKKIRRDESDLRWDEAPVDPAHWGDEENTEGSSWDVAREIVVSLPVRGEGEASLLVEYEGRILDSLRPPEEAYARSFWTTTGLIEERGAFLGGSTVWVPTVPGDLFTFRLEAKVPGDWECVSQGGMEARYDEGSRRIVRWEAISPMEEIYVVAGPYVLRETDVGGRKFQSFLYDADDGEELHQRYGAATGNYLERYSREIGEYPFPKFALVENFWQTGFGMPSFTLLGEQVIRLPFIISTSYGHEILHNWWGNGVYVDWEKGNWCEGLTAYGADYAYKAERGPAEAMSYRRGELQKYQDYVSTSEDFPLVGFRSRSDASTQAIGYSKSTMLFHMLRSYIGDGAFREGLRDFYRERKFRVSGWNDLRVAFEKASGADLGRFFEQWTTRPGAPRLGLADVKAKGAWGDKFSVVGKVTQMAPDFRVDVPVRIETEAGVESLVVYLDGPEKSFEWKGKGRPLAVAVDPDFDVFRRLERGEIPAALSGTLGADSVLIVLPPEGACPFDDALVAIAEQWGSSPGAMIVRDTVSADLFRRRSAWLLGPTIYDQRFFASLPSVAMRSGDGWVTPGGRFPADTHTVVFTARHPENPDLTWSLLMPSSGDPVPSIGRKIPHYSRYGYLVFEGDTNVDKGEWPVTDSPLRVMVSVE